MITSTNRLTPTLAALALVLCTACVGGVGRRPDYARPLPEGAEALIRLQTEDRRPDFRTQWIERRQILPALDESIQWTAKPSSRKHFPKAGVSHDLAERSLLRFREVLMSSRSSAEFVQILDDEFDVYRSAGWDGRGGGVLFTGYCTPILAGSLERTTTYRYPLYSLPPDLLKGEDGSILGQQTTSGVRPYPSRRNIERRGLLDGQGLEIAWLSDPIDAFIAHVNGSAVVQLPDGELLRLGYSGKNGLPYSSLREALERSGQIEPGDPGLPALRAWAARSSPETVQRFLHRNDSYVFFTEISGTPHGSLNVPVTGERTLATDKSLFPRGALVFVDTRVPSGAGEAKVPFRRFMLDQDTGGAIRTAGRADIYLGVGDEAELRAGTTAAEGQLYYLFLKR